jgi:hypothetical protein
MVEQPSTGLYIYFLIAVAVAIPAHWFVKRYLLACAVSALCGPVAFVVACLLHRERLTLLEPGALTLFAALCFFVGASILISAAVGVFFVVRRHFLSVTPNKRWSRP